MTTTQQIQERLISSGLATPDSIIGCSDTELTQIATCAGRELPTAYRQFMAKFGKKAGRFLRDVEIFYPAVLGLRSVAEEIVRDYEEFQIELPSSAFVFSMRQKEQFMFFDDYSDDPPVKFYMSGDAGFTTIANRFWEVIESELEVAVENYEAIKGTPLDFHD